jgi:hypothetical protein
MLLHRKGGWQTGVWRAPHRARDLLKRVTRFCEELRKLISLRSFGQPTLCRSRRQSRLPGLLWESHGSARQRTVKPCKPDGLRYTGHSAAAPEGKMLPDTPLLGLP